MADKITTLKEEITGNDVYPNVKEENIPDTIQRKLTSGDGITIENNEVSLGTIQDKNIPDSTNKEVVFNNGVKTNKVTDLNGYKIVEDDNSHINVGNTSRLLQMYGSGSRPTYGGMDLAFYSDTQENNWDLLWANLGIGRWAGQRFYYPYSVTNTYTLVDRLSMHYTSLIRCFSNISLYSNRDNVPVTGTTIICPDLPTLHSNEAASFMFAWWEENSNLTLMLGNGSQGGQYMFGHSPAFIKIDIQEGKTFQITNYSQGVFARCSNLEYIGPIDMSLARQTGGGNAYMFLGCSKLKTIKITHWTGSFDISDSTAFEEADLVEILNNLDAVSTTQTLTMGATNLAKLTTDDILIATGKGWQLA